MKKFKNLSKKDKAEYIAMVALYPLFMLFNFLGKSLKVFSTKERQIVASILTACMIFTMIPMTALTAFAAHGEANPTTWEELQEAINKGGDIKLTQDITCTSPTTANYLNVPKDTTVTIDLNGKTIDRNIGEAAIADGNVIKSSGNLTIKDTSTIDTALQGKITGGTGGGVYNIDTFNMTGGNITGNTAMYGGGVFNSGTFTMNGGNISGNTASGNGGGVYSIKTFTMTGGNITGNTATHGGGVYSEYGTFTMTGGNITGNTSAQAGGGVCNYGTFTMTDGNIFGNTASGNGGGVYNLGTFTMTGGNITGNTSTNDGGGVRNTGTFKVSGSATVTGNVKGGTITDGVLLGGTVNNVPLPSNKNISVTGALTGEIGVTSSSSVFPTTIATGDGYTLTANDATKFTSDKDGFALSLDENNNIVLDEYKLDTWEKLQEAINAGGDIKLTQDITCTRPTTMNPLIVPTNTTVTIDLNGKTIDRNIGETAISDGCVILSSGNLTIKDTSSDIITKQGKITGGNNTDYGSGVNNKGTFTMNGGNISGNTSLNYGGGGVFNSGTFTMNGGTISGNTASQKGGGVCNGGTFTMNGGAISGNTSTKDGGGVWNRSTFTMTGGNITGNTSTNDGGGVYNYRSTFTMNGGNITGNTSLNYGGGGVCNDTGTFTMTAGTISGNTSTIYDGGGVRNTGTFKVSGSATVTGNVKDGTITDGVLTGGTVNNVQLPSNKNISVTGALTGEIGVTSSSSVFPATIATGDGYTLTANDATKFASDKTTLKTSLSEGNIVLESAKKTLTKDNFTLTPPSNVFYSGTGKTATVEAKSGISCGAITVKYYTPGGSEVATPKNAGTYTVKINVATNAEYNAATALEVGTFTIAPKALTVSVADVSINKGQSINSLTVNFDGFVSGENAGNITGFEKPRATVNGNVDTLDTSLTSFNVSYSSGATGGNYAFSFTNTGTIKINKVNVSSGDFSFNKDVSKWQKADLIITPVTGNGYSQISSDGKDWKASLTLSAEGASSSQTFFLKRSDGTVTESKTITYKLDKTAPTGIKVQYNEGGFKSFLNTISFGLFFKENVNVSAQATDDLSGIAKCQYFGADSQVNDTSTITGWQDSLTLTKNSKKLIYIKAIDNAGNETIVLDQGVVAYSDSTVTPTNATFDLNANKQADIELTMALNDNTLREIKNGAIVLISGTDYTVSGSKVTLSKNYLKTFSNSTTQVLSLVFNPMGVESETTSTANVSISIVDTTHVHVAVAHTRVEATCTVDGNVDYWSCTGCDKLFSDEACTAETTLQQTVIAKIAHKNSVKTNAKAETCTADGNTAYWTCPDCNKIFSDEACTAETTLQQTVIAKIAHKNSVKTNAKAETCTVDGNTAYWTCPDCTKLFSDEACTAETTLEQTVIAKIAHKNSVKTNAKAETCTADGNTAYWTCPDCTKLFSDEAYTTETTLPQTVIAKLGHSYTAYVSDGNATYFQDGTETSPCVRPCGTTNTRTAVGSKLIDSNSPTATMRIAENEFSSILSNITFGLFFNKTQTVSVIAKDKESGVDKTYYYLASEVITDFSDVNWSEFTDTFDIAPNNKYVVYVAVTDKIGNQLIINSDGIVLENIVPQISATDKKTYCGPVTVAVTDDNLDTVTVNNVAVTLIDGKFTASPATGTQTIVATDLAGNVTTVTITVNDGHTWGDGKITKSATSSEEGETLFTCTVCDETKTEVIKKLAPIITDGKNNIFKLGSKDGLIFRSNAALKDLIRVLVDGLMIDRSNYTATEGSTIITLNADYLSTLSPGTHKIDIESVSGTATADFTIDGKVNGTTNPADTTKPGNGNSPKTGDESISILWISLFLASSGALTMVGMSKKRKKAVK